MKRKTWLVRKIFRRSIIIFALVLGASASIYAQSTVFTYQGKLVDGALPASASYDFEFRLFDSLTGGTQLGSAVKSLNVPVANGIFTVLVDFGSQFSGEDRFLAPERARLPLTAGRRAERRARSGSRRAHARRAAHRR